MRNLILTIIFFTTTTFSCAQNKLVKKNAPNYFISKIDSINNYYLVYAEKGDSLYKIVSKKSLNKCIKIETYKEYSLLLHSMSSQAPVINGVKLSPINYLDVSCFRFDKNTDICKEDGIHDLYLSDNLEGLCIVSPE